MTIRLSSPAFTDAGAVPRQYTCDGADLSPPLDWADLPPDTVELALLVEDPDAPGTTFVHWVMWAVSPTTKALPEGSIPPGARQGRNGLAASAIAAPARRKSKDPTAMT
jgi:Raf kinase inhibitor-like YbhB/YbcL family protein